MSFVPWRNFAVLVPFACCSIFAQYKQVDPRIGTANSGQTVPSVGMPFAMTTWTPETRATEEKCVAAYYDEDKSITGFRGSHFMSGSCGYEYGGVTLMPTSGPVTGVPEKRGSEFAHDSEVMGPAYYAVTLKRYGIRVEMTGSTRSGFLRIHYPAGVTANLVIDSDAGDGGASVRVLSDARQVIASNAVTRRYAGGGKPAGFSGHFVVQVQSSIEGSGFWCGEKTSAMPCSAKGQGVRSGAFLRLRPDTDGVVLVKIGSSLTSAMEAKKNLQAEIPGWDFDEVRRSTQRVWEERLRRIQVEGGTPEQQTVFYTALYHASLAPRIVSDVDGAYNGFAQEGKLHTAPAGKNEYGDFSLWDTFRALHPLLTIIDPERDEDMIRSLIDKGEQGGFLPIFPAWNSYTSEMIGDHVSSLVMDAYAKGLRSFDVDAAYRLMVKNADVTPDRAAYVDGQGRRGLPSYLKYGYIPLEDEVLDAFHHHEQVSRTLEYAYDDFLIGKLARARGDTAVAARMEKRSAYWRNVFDPSTGFVRGRHEDGTWAKPFDPGKPQSYITESTPWQYTFFVPQDLPGLIAASGGAAPFIQKLDGVFQEHRYDQGNEPGHQMPYLYDYAGAAWKTQARVRALMKEQYNGGPAGLPGNEDAGQMSAWYIFGAMGFYPVCPGVPEYALGSPLFTKMVVRTGRGRSFTINAGNNSDANLYVQSVRIDGKPADGTQLKHATIAKGGRLDFIMGPHRAGKLIGSSRAFPYAAGIVPK